MRTSKRNEKQGEKEKREKDPFHILTVALAATDLSTLQKNLVATAAEDVKEVVEAELSSMGQQVQIGEMAFRLLTAHDDRGRPIKDEKGQFVTRPLEQQKAVVTLLAKALGVPVPSYEQSGAGRPPTGRKQLTEVLYWHHQDLLKREEGENDSRAGKRLTASIAAYKDVAGLSKPSLLLPAGPSGKPPVSLGRERKKQRDVGISLMRATTTSNEFETLTLLFKRIGVPGGELDKWEEEAKKKDEIIDVTPTASNQ